MLSNLIANALDAMSQTGGILYVRTHEATDWKSERKGVTITVADTGRGMSPEVQAKICQAFYTTEGARGTGLGLWISSEIVERHRGRLIVRSSERQPRRGTVFQLFLPYQAASGEGQAEGEEISG